MNTVFYRFTTNDYQAVCDFLVKLNESDRSCINWNWARWEWMYSHPYTNRDQLPTIGLWKQDETVVGAALFDMYHGEAFCAALDEHQELLPEILDYAKEHLSDENGLGISVNDENRDIAALLQSKGFHAAGQTETLMCIPLPLTGQHRLPEGFSICQTHFPEDNLAYQTVIWKGFDHGDDPAELERMLSSSAPLPVHRRPELCLSVRSPEGEFAAHCTCWYDSRTDYAYVEPLCTVPEYRGMGLGSAVLAEALNRCARLGAARAYVISDMDYYKRFGFAPCAHYTFYWTAPQEDTSCSD